MTALETDAVYAEIFLCLPKPLILPNASTPGIFIPEHRSLGGHAPLKVQCSGLNAEKRTQLFRKMYFSCSISADEA